MSVTANAKQASVLAPEEVAQWLRDHPDFFQNHEALLAELKLPHAADGAVSLIEHQVNLLRRKIRQKDDRLSELIERAKDNHRLSGQLHSLALTLMEADTVDSVLSLAREQLVSTFNAEAVSIKLFKRSNSDTAGYFINPRDISRQFASAYRTHNPMCGTLNKEQNALLFQDEDFEVKSSVFIPLNEGRPIGFLSMGSARKSRFTPTMGTHFIRCLGELVGRAIVCQENHRRGQD